MMGSVFILDVVGSSSLEKIHIAYFEKMYDWLRREYMVTFRQCHRLGMCSIIFYCNMTTGSVKAICLPHWTKYPVQHDCVVVFTDQYLHIFMAELVKIYGVERHDFERNVLNKQRTIEW